MADGIYQHVDVKEEGKENAFSLGHTLWINTEVRLERFSPSSLAYPPGMKPFPITSWFFPAGV